MLNAWRPAGANLHRASQRPIPPGDAGQTGHDPDDRGLRLPRFHLGRGRGPLADRAWREPLRLGGALRLLCLGIDHRSAPTAVREALAFDGDARDNGLDMLRSTFQGAEFVLLSTCNRVGKSSRGGRRCPADPRRLRVDSGATQVHRLPADTIGSHLVAHDDEAVVGHLFRVASSLESLVLGEGQILGQVRDAYLGEIRRDRRADLARRLSASPQGRKKSSRRDRDGPRQTLSRQRGRGCGAARFSIPLATRPCWLSARGRWRI